MQVTPSPIAHSRKTHGVSTIVADASRHSPESGKVRSGNLNALLEMSHKPVVDLIGGASPEEIGSVFQALRVAILFNACLGIAGMLAYEVWKMLLQ